MINDLRPMNIRPELLWEATKKDQKALPVGKHESRPRPKVAFVLGSLSFAAYMITRILIA